jgi:hypothetical protein
LWSADELRVLAGESLEPSLQDQTLPFPVFCLKLGDDMHQGNGILDI